MRSEFKTRIGGSLMRFQLSSGQELTLLKQ